MTSNDNHIESSSSFDVDIDEWDGTSPFWVHCVAGSLAGVAEHTLVYPLDTVRTHIQVCAACHFNGVNNNTATATAAKAVNARLMSSSSTSNSAVGGSSKPAASVLQKAATHTKVMQSNLSMIQAIRQLMSQPLALETAAGANATTTTTAASTLRSTAASTTINTAGMSRLWRGVQTILVGCIPAHALYFSSYEIVKAATLDQNGNVTTYGSALAGAAAVVAHDIILGPLDTVKQRLQLGHYRGLSHAVSTMIKNEGAISLYRSFPVTLATNIPYGMVMVGTNEFCKQQWTQENNGQLTLGVTLGASSLAGLVAAATTTPLDRIKTYLQTQQLSPACLLTPAGNSPEACPLQAGSSSSTTTAATKPIVADWKQAAMRIYKTEGMVGFFRGMTPRILSHTPAVAISWTTYEAAKRYLTTFAEE
mmetsp:Transcript_21977/g.38698  ORF Transcript_21977/g.38698 Transcript_21977/m.38698 type:complete len:422 (+) Transcript_21977:304-1569(+)